MTIYPDLHLIYTCGCEGQNGNMAKFQKQAIDQCGKTTSLSSIGFSVDQTTTGPPCPSCANDRDAEQELNEVSASRSSSWQDAITLLALRESLRGGAAIVLADSLQCSFMLASACGSTVARFLLSARYLGTPAVFFGFVSSCESPFGSKLCVQKMHNRIVQQREKNAITRTIM
jgi:hypothetical protein